MRARLTDEEKILGENIDRICTVEMRRPGTIPRGVIRPFYEAAVEEGGGDPLSYRAGKLLMNACSPGAYVFIICNAGVPPYLPFGETDGPPGGAAIAHALSVATGAIPVFISSDGHAPPVVAAARATGLFVLSSEMAAARPRWVAIDERYNETTTENDAAEALFDKYNPAAIIAVEVIGPNKDDLMISATGYQISDCPTYHNLFRIAAERGVPSIGMGDGGNEIGCARIQDKVREIFPTTTGGHDVATVVATDVLFFASVSNWGGYGIAAMIAFLAKNPKALHSAYLENRVLEAVVDAGAGEGGSANLYPDVDLIDRQVHVDLVNTLGVMVRNALDPLIRPY